jgi:O-antigen ligase
MSPPLATLLTIALVLLLLRLDRPPAGGREPALWLPVTWLAITGSRFVSQWLDLRGGGGENFTEGSPLDAAVFLVLMIAGLVTLRRRGLRAADVARANAWIVLFLAYGLLSVLWSDEPFIAFKRWIKVLGHPIMALVVLTDPDPVGALRTLTKRLAFLLLPASLLFIKYYPEYGRAFDPWSGAALNVGVMLTKNDLGYVCMVLGLALSWNALQSWQGRDMPNRWRELGISASLFALSVWLLLVSDSKTSLTCLTLGLAVMIGLRFGFVSKRHFALWLAVLAAVVWWLEQEFDLYASTLQLLQRSPTLTDRTEIWHRVLEMNDRPWFGYGFESFWLGARLDVLWQEYWWRPTQAHNGYIETYLHLGIVGSGLLLACVLSAFRRITQRFATDLALARLQMALLFAILLFNYAEAGFKGLHFMWTFFYLVALACPRPAPAIQPRRAAAPQATVARGLR